MDDLWKEKRKSVKMELLSDLPDISPNKNNKPAKMNYLEPKGSPFIESRRVFKMTDYNDPRYQEKEYDPNAQDHIFRRTNFRMNDRNSRSRSRSRSGSTSIL